MNVGNPKMHHSGRHGAFPDTGELSQKATAQSFVVVDGQNRAGRANAGAARAAFARTRASERLWGSAREVPRPHSVDENAQRAQIPSPGSVHCSPSWASTAGPASSAMTSTPGLAAFAVRVAAQAASAIAPSSTLDENVAAASCSRPRSRSWIPQLNRSISSPGPCTGELHPDVSSSPTFGGLLSAVRRYAWTRVASFDRHNEARREHARDKLIGAAYVFMNALQSGETLDKHFNELTRQVRRLDKYVVQYPGTPHSSERVLGEVAARYASVRETTQYKVLAFDREGLLWRIDDAHALAQADAVLLAMECSIVGSIAVYGPLLRALCGAATGNADTLDALHQVLDATLVQESAKGFDAEGQRQDWLAVAVRRLPQAMLESLQVWLSKSDVDPLQVDRGFVNEHAAGLLADVRHAVGRRYASTARTPAPAPTRETTVPQASDWVKDGAG